MVVWYAEFDKNFDGNGFYQCEREDFIKYFKYYRPANVEIIVVFIPSKFEVWHWSEKTGWFKSERNDVEYIFGKLSVFKFDEKKIAPKAKS